MRSSSQRGASIGPLRRWLGGAFLRLNGWTWKDREIPDKAVMTGFPHTTNWDGPFMIATAWVLGLELYWMGKKSLFRWPLGLLVRAVGGVPVDRSNARDVVEQVAEQFKSRDRFLLVIAPEGSRSYRDYWKSGFYRIAKAAGVPVILTYLDYGNKESGIGEIIYTSDNPSEDMDRIRAFFEPIRGLRPKNQGPIRLRVEMGSDERPPCP